MPELKRLEHCAFAVLTRHIEPALEMRPQIRLVDEHEIAQRIALIVEELEPGVARELDRLRPVRSRALTNDSDPWRAHRTARIPSTVSALTTTSADV